MSQKTPFDKEKFVNSCPCGCSKSRQSILDGIEKYKESDPQMVQYLEWYRDELWEKQLADEAFRAQCHDLGAGEQVKRTVEALRAFADRLEQPGMHFIIHCELPPMPIFSGEDFVEKHHSRIMVHMVKGPLGG